MNKSYTIHETATSKKSHLTPFLNHNVGVFYFKSYHFIFRRQGFVPAESVMNFRKQLGCDTFRTEEKGKCLTFSKHCLKIHTKELFNEKIQHNKDGTINHQFVTISLIDVFSLQTQRSSSQSCSRRFSALSRCWSSGKILRHSLQHAVRPGSSSNVQLNCCPAGRMRKYLRVPTPSRSSWRGSSWDRCPLSSSC